MAYFVFAAFHSPLLSPAFCYSSLNAFANNPKNSSVNSNFIASSAKSPKNYPNTPNFFQYIKHKILNKFPSYKKKQLINNKEIKLNKLIKEREALIASGTNKSNIVEKNFLDIDINSLEKEIIELKNNKTTIATTNKLITTNSDTLLKINKHSHLKSTMLNVFIALGSFIVAFIFGSFMLIPSDSNAEDNISTLANDASLSIAIDPSTINLSSNPTSNGTLSTEELNININTDNTTGYTLTLASSTDNTALTNTNPNITNNNTINSTTASIGNPSTLTNNTWGWYPSSLSNNPGTSTGNYQFIAIPNSSDPYTIKTTDTPTSDTGDTNTISIATNIDTTLPAGNYTNTLTITAITNFVPQPILDVYPTTGWGGDTITLYSNGGFINVQSVTIGGTECTSINTVSDSELTCVLPTKAASSTGYNITVTASNTSLETHNFTIRYFNPASTTSMQDFDATTCGSMNVGDVVSLTDTRNNQTYRIKKMQDNKCWMIDNMKYLGEGITINNTADSTQGMTLNNTSGRYNTVDGTDTQSSANSDKAFYNNPMSLEACYGTTYADSYTKCGYLYNWYAATAGTGTYNVSTAGNNVSGSICPSGWRLPSIYSDGSTPTGNGTSVSAADFPVLNASMNAGSLTTGSISSYYAGWQYSGAWSGVFSGSWYNGFHLQGSNGYYWSSTTYSSTGARYLLFHSSVVSPANVNDKYSGHAVRCVHPGAITINFNGNGATGGSTASQMIETGTSQNLNSNGFTRTGYKFTGWNTVAGGTGTSYNNGASYSAPANPSSYTITLYAQWEKEFGKDTMQGFTVSDCQASASSSNVTLRDLRDNNSYTVRYINGNCWMTQNLRLAGGTTLTSTYSNVSSSYTIPTTDLTNGNSYIDGRIHNSGNTTTGYWYNFCAASAGTNCQTSTTTNTTYDICPKGWRLPTLNEFSGITGTSYISAFSPIYGGYYYGGSLYNSSTDGYWWSSTANDSYDQYNLNYYSGNLSTSYVNGKNFGFYVRCIRSS